MLELARTVRLCINADAPHPNQATPDQPRDNTFAAWPPPRGLARYVELRVACQGHADPQTGYFINIRNIDAAVRSHALPHLIQAAHDERTGKPTPLGQLLRHILQDLQPDLHHTVHQLQLQLTPVTTMTATQTHPDPPATVLIRQRYEFSAAHRLHVPDFTDQQNRDTFGKCNNPAGHGHNYTFEVAVQAPIDPQGHTLDIAQLDAVVDQHAVQKLDHTHLNHDVPEFKHQNPSVENISAVIWNYLADQLPDPTTLREITVWETGKTACTYRGQP